MSNALVKSVCEREQHMSRRLVIGAPPRSRRHQSYIAKSQQFLASSFSAMTFCTQQRKATSNWIINSSFWKNKHKRKQNVYFYNSRRDFSADFATGSKVSVEKLDSLLEGSRRQPVAGRDGAPPQRDRHFEISVDDAYIVHVIRFWSFFAIYPPPSKLIIDGISTVAKTLLKSRRRYGGHGLLQLLMRTADIWCHSNEPYCNVGCKVSFPVCPCCRGRTCFQCSAPFGYVYSFQSRISVCINHIILSQFFFFNYSAIGQVPYLSTPFGCVFCHPLYLWMIHFVFFFVNNIFLGLSGFFFFSFDSPVTFVSNDFSWVMA